MTKYLSLTAALALAALVAVPAFAQTAPIAPAPGGEPGEVVCTGFTTVAGTVLALEVVTVYELPRGTEGNGRRYAVLTVLEDGGGVSRVLVPWDALPRGFASSPKLGDSVAASASVEVVHGFPSPQWVARGFSVVPHS